MEILLFGLGMVFALLIAVAIVGPIAFFKVTKVKKEVDQIDRYFSEEIRNSYRAMDDKGKELDQRFAEVFRVIADENSHINRRIDTFEKDIYSQLDSRLDKLENKLTNKK